MDALRKAEESKKQAEQEERKPEKTGLPELQEEPVGTAAPDAELSKTPIPDTELEFEENPEARTVTDTGTGAEKEKVAEPETPVHSTTGQSTASASVPTGEIPAEQTNAKEVGVEAADQILQVDESSDTQKQEETSAKVTLSLEPMDESTARSARKPLDVSAAPDYSAESQLKSAEVVTSKSDRAAALPSSATAAISPAPPVSDNPQQALEAAMLRASSKFTGSSKPRDGADRDASASSSTPAEYSSAARSKPELGKPSVPASPGMQETGSVNPSINAGSTGGKTDAAKSLESKRTAAPAVPGKAAVNPGKTEPSKSSVKLQKPGQSISDRSAPDRRAARSVFAAKRKGKRLRIRRSTKIWALQIIAVIALLGVGYVFFYATTPSSDFNVPAEYLTNASSFTDEFANDEFTGEVESAVAVEFDPESGIEPAAVEAVAGLQDQVTTAVIGEPVTTTPAAADEPTQALPRETATVAVLDEEIASSRQATGVEVGGVSTRQATTEVSETASIATTTNMGVASTPADTETETETTAPAVTFSGINFVRRETVSTVDPMLRQAYEAYQRGELSNAQALYQQVLEETPQQRDAMLGLAAIASSNQDVMAAMQLYSGLLARDPSDSVARAGLLALRPAGNIADQEREFRRLLAQQGNVAAVVYAVGNFYAAQGRWNEAQRHYFNALQLAKADDLDGIPVNPDYAFNLAVSLERINQAEAASTYYQEAITFAVSHTASFDLSIARSRLASLAEVGS